MLLNLVRDSNILIFFLSFYQGLFFFTDSSHSMTDQSHSYNSDLSLSNNFLSFHHLSLPHTFSFIIFLLSTILHPHSSFLPQSISYSPLSNYCSSWTLSYFPVNTEEKFTSCLYKCSRFRWDFDLCINTAHLNSYFDFLLFL